MVDNSQEIFLENKAYVHTFLPELAVFLNSSSSPTDLMEKPLKKIHSIESLYQTEVFWCFGLCNEEDCNQLKIWLSEKKNRMIFFLENHLPTLHQFLSCAYSREIVRNTQIKIIGFHNVASLLETLALTSFHSACMSNWVSATLDENHFFSSFFLEIETHLYYLCAKTEVLLSDVLRADRIVNNIIGNMQRLEGVYDASFLTNQFDNIPAIVCGAGPSLEKNYTIVSQLQDKALIIACGSAITKLTHWNIDPHFGIALDPSPKEFDILKTHKAKNMMLIFRNRLFHTVTDLFDHKAYLANQKAHPMSNYYENHLGIKNTLSEDGITSLTMGCSFAHLMACNPIILVGADLAYTHQKTHAGSLPCIPTHSSFCNWEKLIKTKDIYGKETTTAFKWLVESDWISQFAEEKSSTSFLNGTEGGLGFKGIENIVLQKYFTENTFSSHLFHTEIQKYVNTAFPASTTKKSTELTKKLYESLMRASSLCQQIIQFFQVLELETSINSSLTTQLALLEDALQQELIYPILIQNILLAAEKMVLTDFRSLENSKQISYAEKIELLELRKKNASYLLLQQTLNLNEHVFLSYIDKTLSH